MNEINVNVYTIVPEDTPCEVDPSHGQCDCVASADPGIVLEGKPIGLRVGVPLCNQCLEDLGEVGDPHSEKARRVSRVIFAKVQEQEREVYERLDRESL